MRGYAETDVFSERELDLLAHAREIVAVLPAKHTRDDVREDVIEHLVQLTERHADDKTSLTISGPPWHTTFSPGRTL